MNAADITSAAKDSLVDDFRALIGFVGDLLHATTGKTGERLDAVGAKLDETLDGAKLRVESAQALLVEGAQEAAQAADEYVHEHPWKSVGIATGIGLIVGFLISRR